MDIIASILAYLGCLGGILAALTVSVSVLLSAPATTAAATANKAPLVTSGQKHDRLDSNIKKLAVQPTALTTLSSKQVRRLKDLRRLVLQQRATRLADQDASDFEARFIGYVKR